MAWLVPTVCMDVMEGWRLHEASEIHHAGPQAFYVIIRRQVFTPRGILSFLYGTPVEKRTFV